MNAEQIEILGTLRSRMKTIIQQLDHEQEEGETLRREKRELLSKIAQQEQLIKELEQKYNNLKIAKSLLSTSNDSHDAKIKVNRIVREIDKCIALLNR